MRASARSAPRPKEKKIVKRIQIASYGIIALCAAFAPAAHADCGKPNSRQAMTALSTAHALAARSELDDARPADDLGRQPIVGLWLATGTIDGQQTQAFESFAADGLEFLNDNGSPIEGNVCLGIWQVGPKGVISVNHPSWYYDPAGNLIGTAVIKEQITLDPGAKAFHGTITVDIYDLNGNLQVHLAGTYTGKRITI